MSTRYFAPLFLIVILAACGESDPYAASKQRLIDDCVTGGESITACECQIEFAKNELTTRDFHLVLEASDAQRLNLSAERTAARLGVTGQELVELSRRLHAVDRPAVRYCQGR